MKINILNISFLLTAFLSKKFTIADDFYCNLNEVNISAIVENTNLIKAPGYGCTLEKIVENNLFNQIIITYKNGKQNCDIKVLKRHKSGRITNVNSIFCDVMNNLEVVSFVRVSAEKIEADSFHKCKLKIFEWQDSKLTKLPENFFLNQKELKLVVLKNNKINYLPQKIFQPLTKLEILNIAQNEIKNFDAKWLANLFNLNQLIIAGNPISNIPEKAFNQLIKLKVLNIERTSIKSINPAWFTNLHNLEQLIIGYNELSVINKDDFKGLTNLKELHLNNNKIQSLRSNCFDSTSNLEILNLEFNLIAELPLNFFSALKKLKVLNLSNNKLNVIHSKSFEMLKMLDKVDLSSNQISSIDEKFIDNVGVSILDLSKNSCGGALHTKPSNSKKELLKCMQNYNPLENTIRIKRASTTFRTTARPTTRTTRKPSITTTWIKPTTKYTTKWNQLTAKTWPKWNQQTTKSSQRWIQPTTKYTTKWNQLTTKTWPKWNQPTTKTWPKWNQQTTKWNQWTTKSTVKWIQPSTKTWAKWNQPTTKTWSKWNQPTTKTLPKWNQPTTKTWPKWNQPTTKTWSKWNQQTTKWNQWTTKSTVKWIQPTTTTWPKWNQPTTKTWSKWNQPTTKWNQWTTKSTLKWNQPTTKSTIKWIQPTVKSTVKWIQSTAKSTTKWIQPTTKSTTKWIQPSTKSIVKFIQPTTKLTSQTNIVLGLRSSFSTDNKNLCGRPQVLMSNIFGGSNISRGAFPWLTALVTSKNEFFCGGTIIGNQRVVTAAHCIQDKGITKPILPNNIKVLLGVHDLNEMYEIGTKAAGVDKVHTHPKWNPSLPRYDSDIAVIILAETITFNIYVQPICLISPDLSATAANIKKGLVVGFGKSQNREKRHENIAKKLQLPILTNEECFLNDNILAKLSSNQTFCGGDAKGEGVCIGDSGGGLIINYNNAYYLRGIISASKIKDDDCDVNSFAVFTDVLKFSDWILSEKF